MANSLLTPTAVTREALRILHQKLTFVGNINHGYDDQYAKEGGKIGADLKIRLPNQYVVRNGAVMSAQDTVENSVTMSITTQKGVDLNFSSADLTLSLDDYSSRILQPSMAVLAASIEADAYSMYKDVYQIVDSDGSAPAFVDILNARKLLVDSLTPMDDNLSITLSTKHNVKIVDGLKGLFNDQSTLSKQYRKGMVGHTAGFDFYETTHAGDHTTGTAAKTTTYTVNGANQTGAAITVQTGTQTFKRGDVVTFAGCNSVHPETKASTGILQQFVLTADYAGGAGNLAVSPSIVTSGATQNVSASPTNGGAVVKVGAGANELLNTSMAFHKDAFAIGFVDLKMPKGMDFAAREVYDGISMRIVSAYDIVNDKFPCRIDVMYGYKTVRPQMAARIHADG